jgi:lipoate-protein ligase A
MMESWKVGTMDRFNLPTFHLSIDPVGLPGAENMAIDQALLEEADRTGRAFLRLYRWNPPCLSLGRNEPAATRYEREMLERRGIAVVRRPTGGRAVWHEHEVTYAVAAPITLLGSLRQSYCAIHERLATALRSLGVDATLAERRRPSGSPLGTDQPANRLTGPCFSSPVGGEVLVNGRKVIGSAQVRHGSALLQHGSILLDGSQEIVREVSRQPSAISGEATLRETLGRPVTFEEVADAIVAAWRDEVTPTAPYRTLPSSTVRFSDPSWTWRR